MLNRVDGMKLLSVLRWDDEMMSAGLTPRLGQAPRIDLQRQAVIQEMNRRMDIMRRRPADNEVDDGTKEDRGSRKAM